MLLRLARYLFVLVAAVVTSARAQEKMTPIGSSERQGLMPSPACSERASSSTDDSQEVDAENVTVSAADEVAFISIEACAERGEEDGGEGRGRRVEWTLPEDAPAGMRIFPQPGRELLAVVTGVESTGTWKIRARMQNGEGEEGSRRVRRIRLWLIVKQDERDLQSVDVLFSPDVENLWTTQKQSEMERRLALAFSHPDTSEVVVRMRSVRRLPYDERWRVVLYVEEQSVKGGGGGQGKQQMRRVLPARRVVAALSAPAAFLADVQIERVETLHCQLDCTGHGHCNECTKQCECDAGWMPDGFEYVRAGLRSQDCAWSILRVAGASIAAIGFCALLFYARRHHKSRRALMLARRAARRRQRYEHLRSDEEDSRRRKVRSRKRSSGPPTLVALPPRAWSSSTTSLSSDEELLPPAAENGHVDCQGAPNGTMQHVEETPEKKAVHIG